MKPKLTLPTEYTYTLLQRGPITPDITLHIKMMHLTIFRCSDAFCPGGYPDKNKSSEAVRIMRKTLCIAVTGLSETEILLSRVNQNDQFLGQTQREERPTEQTFRQVNKYLSNIELADKTRLTYMVLAQLNSALNKNPNITIESLLKMFNALCLPHMFPKTENNYFSVPKEISLSGHYEHSKKKLNKELIKRFRYWQPQFPASGFSTVNNTGEDDLQDMCVFVN